MDVERFNTHWTPEPYSGCWLWTGYSSNGRYGKDQRLKLTAHRISWKLYRGEIPQGKQVLHRCDTGFCVNPDHLFLGTIADNMRDKCAKGRWRGTQPARFTPDEVRAIRLSTLPNTQLAKRFGCVHTTIRDIKKNRTWKHVQS